MCMFIPPQILNCQPCLAEKAWLVGRVLWSHASPPSVQQPGNKRYFFLNVHICMLLGTKRCLLPCNWNCGLLGIKNYSRMLCRCLVPISLWWAWCCVAAITEHAKTTFCDEFRPLRHDNCWSMIKIGSSSFTQAYWSLRDGWKMVFKIQVALSCLIFWKQLGLSHLTGGFHAESQGPLCREAADHLDRFADFLQSSLTNFEVLKNSDKTK